MLVIVLLPRHLEMTRDRARPAWWCNTHLAWWIPPTCTAQGVYDRAVSARRASRKADFSLPIAARRACGPRCRYSAQTISRCYRLGRAEESPCRQTTGRCRHTACADIHTRLAFLSPAAFANTPLHLRSRPDGRFVASRS